MAHVKTVLGHLSERMSDSYVLVDGSQVERFLQQVWVTGPGNANPGQVVLTPTAVRRAPRSTCWSGRWAAMAEGAPDETAREYIYGDDACVDL